MQNTYVVLNCGINVLGDSEFDFEPGFLEFFRTDFSQRIDKCLETDIFQNFY